MRATRLRFLKGRRHGPGGSNVFGKGNIKKHGKIHIRSTNSKKIAGSSKTKGTLVYTNTTGQLWFWETWNWFKMFSSKISHTFPTTRIGFLTENLTLVIRRLERMAIYGEP